MNKKFKKLMDYITHSLKDVISQELTNEINQNKNFQSKTELNTVF